jgi:hypothetical protein
MTHTEQGMAELRHWVTVQGKSGSVRQCGARSA